MYSFPLYIDSDQLAKLSTSDNGNQENREKWAESVIRDYESHCQKDFFTEIDPAIEYVDAFANATIHVDAWFVMMDFIRKGRNPGTEMIEAKAIRFEYNTLDIYDYSDSYFKKNRVRIPLCLPLQYVYPGNIVSFTKIISYHAWILSLSQRSKLIRLNVFGRLLKRYEFYKIDPIYIGYEARQDVLPL